ncbi:bacteriocin [Lactobacillus sp. 0.1XD8-4]|uniref:Blp family class II bacteriocin n=1 Tax=Lactobacillus TaxID=1578 RepID=UPI00129E16CF|nr:MULTISPECIES: Blp family class II bacteriocin [Lactobacillus]MRN07135.1 bacteriocin [Lactobacillus sp. 0.1XD8-4]
MQKLTNEQLVFIIGGNRWGNATIGAMTGAKYGVKICRPGGGWAMGGCALVGAGVGGYIGYRH